MGGNNVDILAGNEVWGVGALSIIERANFGLLSWAKTIHKFGINLDVGTGLEDLWSHSTSLTYLQSAETMVVASDVTATDNPTGTGARAIHIWGLNDDFNEIDEEVAINGTSLLSFRRIYRAKVTDCGTYGGDNDGNITMTALSAGTVQGHIPATYSQSQGTHYTIPAGYSGFIYQVSASMDSTKVIDIQGVMRSDADVIVAPFTAERKTFNWFGLDSPTTFKFEASSRILEKTDIRVIGLANAAAKVTCNYCLLLIKDSVLP